MTGVASAVHALGVSRATLFADESTYQSAPFAARVMAEGWASLESLTKKVPWAVAHVMSPLESVIHIVPLLAATRSDGVPSKT